MKKKVRILSPVGYFDSLQAAIDAKADAVYFGIKNLNMRSLSSNNFELDDLKKVSEFCKKNNIESYLTLNSIIYNDEIILMKKIVDEAKKSGIDAIIAHDFSVVEYVRSKGLRVHISTQANISNIDAVRFYSKFADVVVLARELSLEQIKEIADVIEKENIKGPSNKLIEIELFVHGALCMAISGKCYLSLHQYNKSANRGECLQACRRKYIVTEEETNKEILLENSHIMSPKDLCTIANLDKLIDAGASLLKIEGRARKPDYVFTTTKCYKEALESIYSNKYTKEEIERWLNELSRVYNRDFWHGGYYLNNQSDIWCSSHGSQSQVKKTYIGKATNYFSQINVAEFLLHSHDLKIDDEIIIIGPTTGIIKTKVESLRTDKDVSIAYKGELIAIKINQKIRKNDKLYKLEKNEPN
ncbi:MAG: peptidase U32 family protein [Parachlamydiales bacterium]|jgi:putative protease